MDALSSDDVRALLAYRIENVLLDIKRVARWTCGVSGELSHEADSAATHMPRVASSATRHWQSRAAVLAATRDTLLAPSIVAGKLNDAVRRADRACGAPIIAALLRDERVVIDASTYEANYIQCPHALGAGPICYVCDALVDRLFTGFWALMSYADVVPVHAAAFEALVGLAPFEMFWRDALLCCPDSTLDALEKDMQLAVIDTGCLASVESARAVTWLARALRNEAHGCATSTPLVLADTVASKYAYALWRAAVARIHAGENTAAVTRDALLAYVPRYYPYKRIVRGLRDAPHDFQRSAVLALLSEHHPSWADTRLDEEGVVRRDDLAGLCDDVAVQTALRAVSRRRAQAAASSSHSDAKRVSGSRRTRV